MKALDWHREAFGNLIAAKAALPHALLVRGVRGIGKLAFVQALAQALLCESPVDGGCACGTCNACAWFEAGAHPDYRQIEPADAVERADAEEGEKKAKMISVDQIRALPELISMSSHQGGPKVIVIHPVEMLNVNAANALLKSLEEPPPRTQFLLVTHRPQQVLPTIKSRCRQVALPAPDAGTAGAWLASHGVRDPALALAHTGNAPLLALELNDSEYWGTRAAFLRQLIAADLDPLMMAEAIRDFPIPQVVSWLQKWSYDLVYYREIGSVRYNPDQTDAIARLAPRLDRLAAARFHREMVRLQRIVHHPLNARLFLGQLLLSYRDLVLTRRLAA